MGIQIQKCDNRNFNRIFSNEKSFKVIRAKPDNSNHTVILQDLNNPESYVLINTPNSILGDLYSIIIVSNERRYEESKYLDIHDIAGIISEFKSKYPDTRFELNIGLSLSLPIDTNNVNYYGKTYRDSDYIYEFPGDMYMCMVANDCEPDKIYIMVGGLDKDDN